MMNIDKDFKRRIRIQNDNINTYVYDVETGEPINNTTALDIHMAVDEETTVKVTYEEPNAASKSR